MKFMPLVWKNLWSNKKRTILTALSIAFSLFLLATLATVLTELNKGIDDSDALRLIVRRSTSVAFPLPEAYEEKLRQVRGVTEVNAQNWFGGVYKDPQNSFPNFAVDAGTFFNMFPELKTTPDEAQAFVGERTAALAGQKLAARFGWKLGDHITLRSPIYHKDLEFILRGIYTSTDESQFFFHRDYLEESLARPGLVSVFWLKADRAESVPSIMLQADQLFRNSDAATRTETEKAFKISSISTFGNLRGLIGGVSIAVLFALLLISTNTMAMAIRERMGEIAVLRAMGFNPGLVYRVLISESILMSLVGGVLGCFGARMFFSSPKIAVPFMFGSSFYVQGQTIILGLGVAIALGIISALIPAISATRASIVDGLRHVD
jgi:putative ABC transport system permease protein